MILKKLHRNFCDLRKSYTIMSKRDKPVWLAPNNEKSKLNLFVYNSLTNDKTLFKPAQGNKVEWYSCGPTVYDVSHMGHARTYISIDILRRIMRDYLKYDVHYVMNITDVDDKIIKRARQDYLYEKYLADIKAESRNINMDLKEVLNCYDNKISKENDLDMKNMLNKEREKVLKISQKEPKCSNDFISIKDAIATWLDVTHGHSVSDNSIFEDLPRKFEKLFMIDMSELNILPPDELTRVSEYIPKIVEFVVKIVERGLGYESNGSVYFNTEEFDKREEHYYAKLVPSAYGNEGLLQEGEGALSNVEAGEKKSKNDFALWKASKSGEPWWESPWGKGRPGWHIECSAMAGDKCGSHLDIHTGGEDLKFPHHDNELAQSEAYFGCKQWVNYFLHTGHLTIEGCKMSKSLKNFISIKDVLAVHSWRQLRLAFLMSSWKDTLDYSKDLMVASIGYEKMLLDFLFLVRHVIRSRKDSPDSNDTNDNELTGIVTETEAQFRAAICDSFNTRECLAVLKRLVEEVNKHCNTRSIAAVDLVALRASGEYVCAMMRMFGAAKDGESLDIVQYSEDELRDTVANVLSVARDFQATLSSLASGHGPEAIIAIEGSYKKFCEDLRGRTSLTVDDQCDAEARFSRSNVEELLAVLGRWRQDVRAISIGKWPSLLTACDHLRDDRLPKIGIRLQDREDKVAAIDLYPAWAVDDRRAKDVPTKVAAKAPKVAANVDPRVMFAMGQYEGQFSVYDGDGLPTHDANGLELSKNRKAKLKKAQADQIKKYAAAN